MSYFSEVFTILMDNIKDKTLYARRQSWSADKQVRVMTGRLYGTHLAMFDQREDGLARAMPYIPTSRHLTASDWEICNSMNIDALVQRVIKDHEVYADIKKAEIKKDANAPEQERFLRMVDEE